MGSWEDDLLDTGSGFLAGKEKIEQDGSKYD